jgi:hypothetical protein
VPAGLPAPKSATFAPTSHSILLLLQREGLALGESAALLAQLTEGLSGGQLQEVCHQLALRLRPAPTPELAGSTERPPSSEEAWQSATGHGRRRVAGQPTSAAISDAALELLPGFVPLSKEAANEFQEWTALVHQPLPPEVR